ncbi:MAG: hypothetical protein RSB82_01630 [Victivallaceae bacterium]
MYRCRIYEKVEHDVQSTADTVIRVSKRRIREALYPIPEESQEVVGSSGSSIEPIALPGDFEGMQSVEVAPLVPKDVGEEMFNEISNDLEHSGTENPEVGINPLVLKPELRAFIQKDPESNHSFILEPALGDRSSFIFIPEGNEDKAERILIAYMETGKPVRNPRDLKHMVICFCTVYSSAQADWKERVTPSIVAKVGCAARYVKYNVLVINFSSQTVLVYANPQKFKSYSNFRGTKLKINEEAVDRIKRILQKRREKVAEETEGASASDQTQSTDPSDND